MRNTNLQLRETQPFPDSYYNEKSSCRASDIQMSYGNNKLVINLNYQAPIYSKNEMRWQFDSLT